MSRSGSRYPSAYGHTPSYRSYVRGGIDSDLTYPSARASALGSGLGSSSLGSSGLGSSALSSGYDLTLPSMSALDMDLGLPSTGTVGNYSGGQSQSKVTSSSYRSVSDSSRDGGRPLVEYSKSTDTKSTNLGPSGIPRTSVSHASSSYSSEDPYKNRVNSYSYNV